MKITRVTSSRKVTLEFKDENRAKSFREEMRKRFNYPETVSKNQVVHGIDENGNAVYVDSELEHK